MTKLTNNKGTFDHEMAYGYPSETCSATKDYKVIKIFDEIKITSDLPQIS